MAFGIDDAITAVGNLGTTIVKTIWPNPQDQANAQATVIQAQVNAVVTQLQAQQQILLAELNSKDPWTSRAPMSFLYLMYVLMGASLLFAIYYAWAGHDKAQLLIDGFHAWLAAIPDNYMNVFGLCFGAQSGAVAFTAHSDNKVKIAKLQGGQ